MKLTFNKEFYWLQTIQTFFMTEMLFFSNILFIFLYNSSFLYKQLI